ncbi:hypothetical protein CEUSTIGMA_g1022.t1 [Chlamydomonas eustigma]|uniref:Uncharacterized protein n=1 Tax=Chlamydomonas eustigma TaxID=1157962 RepID=A0A250WS10_9CHLO|nr:hypothetical protein CEUSTIGMA_g1022.t1 [Chlamydomonas eustigma]|eukprot:GAX73571.1 hypothetical protein CEUSTIGMA_g1022.t1 [Chlamydomonas eustigma]
MLSPSRSICFSEGISRLKKLSVSRVPLHRRANITCVALGSSARSLQATNLNADQDLTKSIMERVDALQSSQGQAGGAGGRTTYQAFKEADRAWSRLRNLPVGAAVGPAPRFVQQYQGPPGVPSPEFDVVVCGGTLGIFVATALAARGLRVAVLERGPLRGRSQEWNISKKEMEELSKFSVLSEEEVQSCIAVEFNPVRIGFHGGANVWTKDVLNIGVSPAKLIDKVKARFQGLGGAVLEEVALQGISVFPNSASLLVSPNRVVEGDDPLQGRTAVSCKLVLDCMGHGSPIVNQLRWGTKPDGVCIVVGTMASGFINNSTGDVIATIDDLSTDKGLQYFWEAFPAGSGPTDRTTYMFTYLDADPLRPSMKQVMDDYWKLMPRYQGVELSDLEFKRVLFGYFPTYRDSPIQPGFDRVLQIGDASGIQSPLSFGGFGALTRHLGRLTNAVSEAVQHDLLDKSNLSFIHSYNPGLSSAWMLQRAMSVRPSDSPPANLINRMLSGNFAAMSKLGEPVMKPFLQDVIQFQPLLQTMAAQMVQDPLSIPQLLAHVGPGPLADWIRHVAGLGAFSTLYQIASTLGLDHPNSGLSGQLSPELRFRLNRLLESWEYGSGKDYKLVQ